MKKIFAILMTLAICICIFTVSANADAGENTEFNWDDYSLEELLEIQEALTAKIDELQMQWALEHGDRTVSLDQESSTIYVGKNVSIVASVEKLLDSAPDQTKLVWTSSNPEVATVNSSGVVTGVSRGEATIICSAEDNENISDTATVEVIVPVSEVKFEETKQSVLMKEGEENAIQLSCVVLPEDAACQDVTWSSSNDQIATVDETGCVTLLEPGSVVITASSNDEYSAASPKKASCTLTVTQAASTVELDQKEMTLDMGASATLKATVLPENTSDKSVAWESSDPDIVTVSNGQIKAISCGEATIKCIASDGSEVEDECKITVIQMVTGIKLAEVTSPIVLSKDGELQLTAEITPEYATNQTVAWMSSDNDIVTVSQDGKLLAVNGGTATITCSATDGSEQKAEYEVIVAKTVDSIALSESDAELHVGERMNLTAEIKPDDAYRKDVTWSSSDDSIVTVDQSGNITAKAPGTANIFCTAQDGSGTEGICAVKVIVATTKLTIEEKEIKLLLGADENLASKEIHFSVTPDDASYKTAAWFSSDDSIATVDENGVVTGVAPGKATITAKTTDTKNADKVYATVTVSVGDAVQEIKLEGIDDRIPKGTSKKLTVAFTPEIVLDPSVEWSSSDESILKVDASGNVRAVGVGTASITCKAKDGSDVSATQEYTVIQAVTGLKASESKVTLFEGKSQTVSAIATPEDATDKSVTWSSNDESIATVSNDGTITAVRAGKAVITATAADGSGRTCTVSVIVEPALPITLEGMGTGIYQANLMSFTVRNLCSTQIIVNFDFDMDLYDYSGNKLVTSGSYNLGDDETIAANSTKTIKRNHPGIGQAYRKVVTITGVTFYGGTHYDIPYSVQETWTFTSR